ncbi:MAG TPA: circularly permuted type 2 ATP-grasp protein [Pseudolabrys sp.]
MSASGLAPKSPGAWYAKYAPLPGIPDEFIGNDGKPRASWQNFLEQIDADDSERSLAAAARRIRDIEVSYRVHGETGERAWPMSRLPLLIEEGDWKEIAAGVAQRASVIEALLADVYGAGRRVADGIVPAAVVAGSQDYLRPMVGMKPPGGHWMNVYAADLGRGPDGRWWVIGDRAQAPSGAGYALENRLVMSRAWPARYRSMNVERLAPFFRAFRSSLAESAERSEPRICLLTPGPYSETYFEQAYLARYLGFLLVEGDDLVVHQGLTHVRTIAGLKRADVIWRRVDSDFIDPLELNGRSRLGVPGILSAMRNGHTAVANVPGSGFAESRALMNFMPAIAEHLLGEDLRMPNIATWWCGGREAHRKVLANFDSMAIAGAFGNNIPGFESEQQVLPGSLPPAERARLFDAVEARGLDYVGQEVVRLSTAPVWNEGELVPRPFVLRVFATVTPDGWKVMPGGFCRISARPDARAVTMGENVQSADVWVLSSKPVVMETLLPANEDIRIRRLLGNLPSRAADNLFWYGRYLERAEATLRVVRCLCARSLEIDLSSGDVSKSLAHLAHQLVAWGAVSAENENAPTLKIVRQALCDEEANGSGLSGVRLARNAGSIIRERISTDASKLLRMLDSHLTKPGDLTTEADVFEAADRGLQMLAALAGLEQENMNRSAGWRFLDMGRRTERAINTCRLARTFAAEQATADDLDVLLDLIDSQITYRSRYVTGIALAPVRDMVLLDPFNPRSVGFQVELINQHIATLPALHEDGLLEEPRQIVEKLATEIATSVAGNLENSIILALEQKISSFADAVASRYFLQRPEIAVGMSSSGLA